MAMSNPNREIPAHMSLPRRDEFLQIPKDEDTLARMSRISPEMQHVENTLKGLLKSVNFSSPEEVANLKKLTDEVQRLSVEVRAIQSQLHGLDKPSSSSQPESRTPPIVKKPPVRIDLNSLESYYSPATGPRSQRAVEYEEESSALTDSTATSPGASPPRRQHLSRLALYSPSFSEASSPASRNMSRSREIPSPSGEQDSWRGYSRPGGSENFSEGHRRGHHSRLTSPRISPSHSSWGTETTASNRLRNPRVSPSSSSNPPSGWRYSTDSNSGNSNDDDVVNGRYGSLSSGRKKSGRRSRRNSMTDFVVSPGEASEELDDGDGREVRGRRRAGSLDYSWKPGRNSFEEGRSQRKSPSIFPWKGTWGGVSPRGERKSDSHRENGDKNGLSWLDNLKTPRRRRNSLSEFFDDSVVDEVGEVVDGGRRRRKSLTLLGGLTQQLGFRKGNENKGEKVTKSGGSKNGWQTSRGNASKPVWSRNFKDGFAWSPNELSEELLKCMAALYVRTAKRFQQPGNQSRGLLARSGPLAKDGLPLDQKMSREDFLESLNGSQGSHFYGIPSGREKGSLQRSNTSQKNGIGSCKLRSPLDPSLWDPEKHDGTGMSSTLLQKSRPFYGSSDYGYMQCVLEAPLAVCEDSLDTQAFQRYQTLLDHLERVNPGRLCHEERLAFWINLYNAVIMHTHIIHTQLYSESKMSVLMSKAVVSVGGLEISALEIEHCILRACTHRSTQMSMAGSHTAMRLLSGKRAASKLPMVKKFDSSDVRKYWVLEEPEPCVTFALCSGSRSSPALRLYSAYDVKDELERAKTMFLLANVGITSSDRVLIPSITDWYWRDFVSEKAQLGDWLALQLPTPHRQVLQEYLLHTKKRNVGHPYDVEAHDWKFRFLIDPF